MTVYSYGKRVDVERTGVRDPFGNALASGLVQGWQNCSVLADMPVCGKKTAPDLVALRDDGHIAVIECKRASSGHAKKGMFEQVLMYGEILRTLLLEDQAAAFFAQCEMASSCSSRERLPSFVPSCAADALHLWIVVDRWSGRMDVTARYTWEFLNRALEREGRPPIKVWAVGHGGAPMDIAAQRSAWQTAQLTPDHSRMIGGTPTPHRTAFSMTRRFV